MKNLGKIIALSMIFSNALLFGSVVASVEPKNIAIGDVATLNLEISGKDIKQPQIMSICGEDVTSTASRTNIEMINGNIRRRNILSYQFTPIKDCVIEPVEVEIDGEIQKSNSVSFKVNPVDTTKKANFMLSLSSNKKEVLVGEPFEMTLVFKQNKNSRVVDSKFIAPELKGFWTKAESKPIQYGDGDYQVTKVIYRVAAQRVGDLKISPAKIQIATRANSRDMFGMWMQNVKWKTYLSNSLDLHVKALPKGVSLVGDFTIEAVTNKTEINANEALNLIVKIKGDGNFEDIKSLKPYVSGLSIFDEKIVIDNAGLSQKIVFVADEDFTIPPISLKYFDLKTKTVKQIFTKKINIKVNGVKPTKELIVKRQDNEKAVANDSVVKSKTSYIWLIIATIIGFFTGVIITLLKPWKFFLREKTLNIKDHKLLLVKLLPFKNDVEVQNIVDALEKNTYSNEKVDIDKKVIKEIVKKYDIY